MILVFDKAIEKTKHRPVIPDLGKIGNFVTKKYRIFIALFLIILGPALYGYTHNEVYYDLAGTLPKDLGSVMANSKLKEDYGMGASHMILADSRLPARESKAMLNEIKRVEGVRLAAGWDSIVGSMIPEEMIPEGFKAVLKSEKYQLILIMSEYMTASDEVNKQCDEIKNIIKKYDKSSMLIGEAPCTQDLITITNKDFKTVSAVSIVLIFIIIAAVLKSVSLPVILVIVIEFAIFINMGIPSYTGTVLPFIASIVIGTIQLGATVDYAILMTNKYKKARNNGADKQEAISGALNSSLQSVFVSAISFFAATFGVGLYSSIDMISSLCVLLARGAFISLLVVAFILPAMFMVFDKLILKTSAGFKSKTKGSKTTRKFERREMV